LSLSACAAVGPDFKPSEVPWLENWSISTLPLQKLRPSGTKRSLTNGGAISTIRCWKSRFFKD
jgi:hypothetical protein